MILAAGNLLLENRCDKDVDGSFVITFSTLLYSGSS